MPAGEEVDGEDEVEEEDDDVVVVPSTTVTLITFPPGLSYLCFTQIIVMNSNKRSNKIMLLKDTQCPKWNHLNYEHG